MYFHNSHMALLPSSPLDDLILTMYPRMALTLSSLLPQFPKFWNCNHMPSYPTYSCMSLFLPSVILIQ